jgi:CheY-like chemotaxis protein
VLVVEDEILIRMAISDHLRDKGFVVVEAARADEAIQLIEANPAIGLVFSDINMPGRLDGMALGNWIRETHPKLPILFASGYDESQALSPFVAKPYDFDKVVVTIRSLLKKQ